MSVPIYTYLLFIVIMEIINKEDKISIVILDIFNAFGTTVNIVVTLLFLYIIKFRDIYIIKTSKDSTNINRNSKYCSKSKNECSNKNNSTQNEYYHINIDSNNDNNINNINQNGNQESNDM
ncbi:hypothetical protein PIROE2DRAFT_9926 [Piromyces sp. E2]|nr:hypothetical protein PIROE2DRAFT_9926 [Piromyces sp. E2]|eukprot:OUM63509.1 hypothetical protein PIROE2DRAFT_9926 [Piromyces sp. E2]